MDTNPHGEVLRLVDGNLIVFFVVENNGVTTAIQFNANFDISEHEVYGVVAFSVETLKKDIDRHVVEQVGDGDIKLILCMGLNFLLSLELSTSLDLNPLVLRLHAFGFPFPLPLPPGAFFTS